MMRVLGLFIAAVALSTGARAALTAELDEVPAVWNISFSPEHLTVVDEGEVLNFTITVSFGNDTETLYKPLLRRTAYVMHVQNLSPKHVELRTYDAEFRFRYKDIVAGYSADVEVVGRQVGMAKVAVRVAPAGERVQVAEGAAVYDVHVLLVQTVWGEIFRYGVLISTILNTVAFACCLDLKVVKRRFTRPWGIIIGFFFQYVFMPSCSYAMGKFFNLSSTMAFGLLCMGCCPGGGASNMWTVLLHGEVDLSIAMTVISTTASLVMMPLWLFTLGRSMMIDIQQEVSGAADDVTVPFGLIVMTIALVGVPCLIGLLISHYLPRLGRVIGKVVKPFAVVFLLFQIVLGAYTKRYVFSYFSDGRIMIGCMLLPYTAMVASFGVAMAARQGWRKARTIMVETAIQNMALAISVVFAALPHPEADIAIVAPMCAIFANPTVLITLAVGFAVRDCVKKYRKRKYPDAEEEEDDGEVSDTLSELFGENGIIAGEEGAYIDKLEDKNITENNNKFGFFTAIEKRAKRKSSRAKSKRSGGDEENMDIAIQTAPPPSTRGIQPRHGSSSPSAGDQDPVVRVLRERDRATRRRTREEEEDELAYGRHVASQLRQLPRIARQSLRIRIEQLFLQELDRQAGASDQADILARLGQRYAKRKSQVSTGSRLSLLGNVVFGIDMPQPRQRASSYGHRSGSLGRRDRPRSSGSQQHAGETSTRPVEEQAGSSRSVVDALRPADPGVLMIEAPTSDRGFPGVNRSTGEVVVSTAHITLSSPGSSVAHDDIHGASDVENIRDEEPVFVGEEGGDLSMARDQEGFVDDTDTERLADLQTGRANGFIDTQSCYL